MMCYLSIYVTVKRSANQTINTRKTNAAQQIEFAMRMAFLVGTDFVCWMPIIVMGFLSLTKITTIPAIMYVWSAVFLLPINSSLNPYIFTILTREMSKHQAKRNKRGPTKMSEGSKSKNSSETFHTGKN